MTRSRTAPALLLALGLTLLAACGGGEPSAAPSAGPATSTSTVGPEPTQKPTQRPTQAESTPVPEPEKPFGGRRVLAISVDGLNPSVLSPDLTPNVWSLFERGVGTINARTEFEKTVTLPNHVGMVTGRPVLKRNGGHGVVWNSHRPASTVPGAPESIFSWVSEHGGTSITFSGKRKFTIFERTWGTESSPVVIIKNDLDELAEAAAADLHTHARTFTFVHIPEPDHTGHAQGWLTAPYRDAVARADAVVGRLLDAVRQERRLRRSVVVVLTADHGGIGGRHGVATEPGNYTIPFVVAGRGIPHGDLYALSPDLKDPGSDRPDYRGAQPVRNCALANVAADVLDLEPVPGASCNADFAVSVGALS